MYFSPKYLHIHECHSSFSALLPLHQQTAHASNYLKILKHKRQENNEREKDCLVNKTLNRKTSRFSVIKIGYSLKTYEMAKINQNKDSILNGFKGLKELALFNRNG